MHALIVGGQGVGKSTLIRRVIDELGKPVWGFETKKEDKAAELCHGDPVYIYEAGKEHIRREENLVGFCQRKVYDVRKEAFDLFAKKLEQQVPDDHIVLLDELGIMETVSDSFCSAVMKLLDGDVPVIAAVKNKDKPYLESVRNHPNCRCFFITEENRDELYAEVLQHMTAALKK